MDSLPPEKIKPSTRMLQPAPSTGLSYSTEILKIEQEIEHHAQIILNLKIKRNSRLPIFRLPVEILCRIFEHTQNVWTAHTPTKSKDSGQPAWLAVTRVCQHWRNAALNDPSLWTKPPLSNEKWTSIFLERSRMAGLNLLFNDRSSMRKKRLTILAAHIPHTTTFTARRIQKEAMETLMNSLRSTVAPMLENLIIDNTPSTSYYRMLESISLPDTAFFGATKLRHLSLVGIRIPWNSPLLSSLTHLTLVRRSKDTRPMPAELLSTLERNPEVQTLTLRNVFPSAGRLEGIPPGSRPRIPLLALETLNVTCTTVDLESLFSHVALGDTIKNISAVLEYDTSINRPLFKLLSTLNEAISGQRLGSRSRHVTINGDLGDEDFAAMPVSFSTGGGVVRPLSIIPLPSCVPDTGALDLHLELGPTSTRSGNLKEASIGIFSDFFHGLHWDNLSQLIMTDLQVLDPRFDTVLARTFGTLSRLSTVVVGLSSAIYLVNALLLHSDNDPALYPDSIPFPGLQHIGFSGVTFDNEEDEEDEEEPYITIERLLDCLMDRYERGIEIRSISIEKCRYYGEYEQGLLEEVVVDVKWDGQEIYTDEEEEDEEDYDEDTDMDYEDYDHYGHGGWY